MGDDGEKVHAPILGAHGSAHGPLFATIEKDDHEYVIIRQCVFLERCERYIKYAIYMRYLAKIYIREGYFLKH